ncbi:cytochrome c-type biogenesis protein CcmF [bacterium BMS3Abin04]|nr:cytochrome c-type biogenesis protein CcmF [bacterium BMS3Abin04]
MIIIGQISLAIALAMTFFAAIASIVGIKNRFGQFLESGRRAMFSSFAALTIAMILLGTALVEKDYNLKYVAEHVSNSLPSFYAFSSLWAGQAGSLLLWAWLLSLFASIVIIQNKKKNLELLPYVIATLSGILIFFLILLEFVTNPFEILGFTITQGNGLNPLLQNPGMIFHPPSLYLGYVGFSIPFAFAIAALITRKLDSDWIRSTRRWTLFAWLFLTIGNILGAKWAYVELGWGGYWGWDPVENASFMPWLVGTAFLHSIMVQEKKDMLKIWNVSLIVITFLLTILGTFITRSGVIASVHSFGESNLGPLFMTFLGTLILWSGYLIFTRRKDLKSRYHLDAILSRETSFLFNNLILIGAAFAILWGTLFPIISEAVRGIKITVGPPFFDTITVPIGIALILLTGICPLISWRKASVDNFLRNFLIPSFVFIVALITFIILGVHDIYPLLSLSLSLFVLSTIFLEFYRGTAARMKYNGENIILGLSNLIMKYRRRYGGYIVHIGMILIFIGITGSTSFKTEKEQLLKKGDTMKINNYKLTFLGTDEYQTSTVQNLTASLRIEKDGKYIGIASPSKEYYFLQKQTQTEVSITSNLEEDLYLILGGMDSNGAVNIKAQINPLVGWIWWGGYILIGGTLFAMWPPRKKKKRSDTLIPQNEFDAKVKAKELIGNEV